MPCKWDKKNQEKIKLQVIEKRKQNKECFECEYLRYWNGYEIKMFPLINLLCASINSPIKFCFILFDISVRLS